MKRLAWFVVVLVLLTIAKGQAPPPLTDPFLDNFIGQWRVERKIHGRTVDTRLRAEWVLKHHFVRLHYGADEPSPEYEAFVFIGFDDSKKAYVCHWVDVFGGNESLLGHGKLDDKMLAIEFQFGEKEPEITNEFTFDPQTKAWTSLIRQVQKGEWKTFAEEKWTRLEAKQ